MNIFHDFIDIFRSIPYESKNFDIATDSINPIAYTAFYEVGIHIGIILSGFITLLGLHFGLELRYLLIPAIVAVMLTELIFKKYDLRHLMHHSKFHSHPI